VVSAVAKWNGNALKKGQKDLTTFQKTAIKLGKTFATVFAAQKIYAFGKASVTAFMADEKAAKSLAIALKNTGNGFATIDTEGFIARMQKTYRVLDDELRPAFQTILTSTGSVTKAQEGLQLALDISAGTTKDLASVSAALAKGYAGNTVGLSKLNAGLSKAILKTGDMDKITAALSSRFQGQAKGALDTYAKKMDALSIAAANSKEIIGKGLLDSLQMLSGDDGITKAADAMETLSQNVADTVVGMAALLSKVKELSGIDLGPNQGKFFGLLASTLTGAGIGAIAGGGVGAVPGAVLGLTAGLSQQRLAESGKKINNSNTPYSNLSMYMTSEAAERAKVVKTLKDQNAEARKAAQLKAAEKALDELKKKFDIDRINLERALLNSTDDAEKARIRGLIAIMDEDKDAAAKRIAEIDRTEAIRLQGLLDAAKAEEKARTAAGEALKYLTEEARKAAAGLASLGNPNGIYANSPFVFGSGNLPDAPSLTPTPPPPADISNAPDLGNPNGVYPSGVPYDPRSGNTPDASPTVTNNFVFNDAIGTSSDFADAVKRAMQQVNRWGDSTTYAGAIA
jgi:uncharacterized protein YcfJ